MGCLFAGLSRFSSGGFQKRAAELPVQPFLPAHHVALWHRGVALCYRQIMSQPVKLSDALVLDARLAGEAFGRSIAGQVEFWARLGRSVELLLEGEQVLKLCRSAATSHSPSASNRWTLPPEASASLLTSRAVRSLITNHIPISRDCWCASMQPEAAPRGAS